MHSFVFHACVWEQEHVFGTALKTKEWASMGGIYTCFKIQKLRAHARCASSLWHTCTSYAPAE
jgi:hypothetical protein